MKNFILIILILSISIITSCSLLGDDEEDCSTVQSELTEDNLSVPVALWRSSVGFGLSYEPGDCVMPRSLWQVPGAEDEQEGVFQFDGAASYGGTFTQGGEVCARLEKNGSSSNTVCKQLEVLTEDVWTFSTEVTYPGEVTNRTVNIAVGDYVYTGFGEYNEWYRFDVQKWEWEERSGVDLATFQAFTGFERDGKAYILGQNRFLYEYDENSDSWNAISEFPGRLDTTFRFEEPNSNDNIVPYVFPFVGASVDGKGYIGVAGSGRLFSYDFSSGNWTELATYPEPGVRDINWFVWDGKIYLGRYFYDPANNRWNDAPARYSDDIFDKYYAVFDDGVYYQDSRGTTRRFDGTTVTDYQPRTLIPNERGPATGVARVATVGEVAIIPKSFQNQRRLATFTYYKRK